MLSHGEDLQRGGPLFLMCRVRRHELISAFLVEQLHERPLLAEFGCWKPDRLLTRGVGARPDRQHPTPLQTWLNGRKFVEIVGSNAQVAHLDSAGHQG
jgi:hypothetical protein